MKLKLLSCIVGVLIVSAAPASQAQITIGLGFNTCNYNGYYQSCPNYGPPAGVYFGGGHWGGDRRDRGHDRGRRDHH
jgi:hypothetical protein